MMKLTLRDCNRLLFLLGRAVRFAAAVRMHKLAGGDPFRLAERFRRDLETMGATFVKIGQYLAIREDLLSAEFCAELSNLYCNAFRLPFATIRACVETELGGPISRFFQHIDPEPVAAASIAQVHRAVSTDGRTLALKIQRPGIEEVLRSDLRILSMLAAAADRLRLFGSLSLAGLADEITEFTLRELDFETEARTAERLAAECPPGVRVPAIARDLSTRRLLAMEFIEGPSFLDIIRLAEAGCADPFARLLPGVDPQRVTDACAQACFTQIFVTGHFHGDPHPANILVEPDGTVVFIDFGIATDLAPLLRARFARYVEHIAHGEIERAASLLLRLVAPGATTDIRAYRGDTIAFMRRWFDASRNPGTPARERLQAHYQGEMFSVMRRHGVRMPLQQLLFWKALASIDATLHRMPVEYDLLGALATFFGRSNGSRMLSALQYRQNLSAAAAAAAFGRRSANAAQREPAWGSGLGVLHFERAGRSDKRAGMLSLSLLSICLALLLLCSR